MYQGIDVSGLTNTQSSAITGFLKRLRDTTKMKIVLKASSHTRRRARADAGMTRSSCRTTAAQRGLRTSTIDALPEIVRGRAGRMPILVDSGVRRGTDIARRCAWGERGLHRSALHLGLGDSARPVRARARTDACRTLWRHAAGRRAEHSASCPHDVRRA